MKSDVKERVQAAKSTYESKVLEVQNEKKAVPARLATLRVEISSIRETLGDLVLRGTGADEIETLRERLASCETEHDSLVHRKNELFSETWVDKLSEVADVRAELDEALIEFGKTNLEKYNRLFADIETAKQNYLDLVSELFETYRSFYQGIEPIPGFEILRVQKPKAYMFEIEAREIGKHVGPQPSAIFGV